MTNFINTWIEVLGNYSISLGELDSYKDQLVLLHKIREDILNSVGIRSITEICSYGRQHELITSRYNKLRGSVISRIERDRRDGLIGGEDMFYFKERLKYPKKLSINYKNFFNLSPSDYLEFLDLINSDLEQVYFIINIDTLIFGVHTYASRGNRDFSLSYKIAYIFESYIFNQDLSIFKNYLSEIDIKKIKMVQGLYRTAYMFDSITFIEKFNTFIKNITTL